MAGSKYQTLQMLNLRIRSHPFSIDSMMAFFLPMNQSQIFSHIPNRHKDVRLIAVEQGIVCKYNVEQHKKIIGITPIYCCIAIMDCWKDVAVGAENGCKDAVVAGKCKAQILDLAAIESKSFTHMITRSLRRHCSHSLLSTHDISYGVHTYSEDHFSRHGKLFMLKIIVGVAKAKASKHFSR